MSNEKQNNRLSTVFMFEAEREEEEEEKKKDLFFPLTDIYN